ASLKDPLVAGCRMSLRSISYKRPYPGEPDVGFNGRLHPIFALESDLLVTGVGAPVTLLRNPKGYLMRRGWRNQPWGSTGFNSWEAAASFQRSHGDLSIPTEILSETVREESEIQTEANRAPLVERESWPASCLEPLHRGDEGHGFLSAPEFLAHAGGPGTGEVGLINPRPWWPGSGKESDDNGASGGGPRGDLARFVGSRLDLSCGPVRELVSTKSLPRCLPSFFARCDRTATLVGLQDFGRRDDSRSAAEGRRR
ncbi:unnamed protein product, partial [Discosporangium mesarthrocarpum]